MKSNKKRDENISGNNETFSVLKKLQNMHANKVREHMKKKEANIRSKKFKYRFNRYLKILPIVVLSLLCLSLLVLYILNFRKEILAYKKPLVSFSEAKKGLLVLDDYAETPLKVGSFGKFSYSGINFSKGNHIFIASNNIYLCSTLSDNSDNKLLKSSTYLYKQKHVTDGSINSYFSNNFSNYCNDLYLLNLNPFSKDNNASIYFERYSITSSSNATSEWIKIKLNYKLWIYLFLGYFLGVILIITSWFLLIKKQQNKIIFKQSPFRNMFELYYSGKIDFNCVECASDLELIVRSEKEAFICPQCGKPAKVNQSVFHQCWNCDYIPNKVICPSCENEMHFYSEIYNQEEIDNKNNNRILRSQLFTNRINKFYLIGGLFSFGFLMSMLYKNGIFLFDFELPIILSSNYLDILRNDSYLSFLGIPRLYLPIILSIFSYIILLIFFKFFCPKRKISMPNFYRKDEEDDEYDHS